MGVVEFFVLVFVVVLFAAVAIWGTNSLVPKLTGAAPPAIVAYLIWAVAILIIIVAILRATGLIGTDPQIPRLR